MVNCYLEQKEVQKWVEALNRENFDGVQGQRKKSGKKKIIFLVFFNSIFSIF